ncbi:MAG: Leucinerich repeat [Schlesneria sp.]|nr:Leucinerich repeat [Schlesneria sp.]
MSLRIFYRLRQAWGRFALWKRAVAIAISLCLLIQFAFAYSLWRESTLRQQLAGKTIFYLGKSPLPPNVQQQLQRFISPERLQLLAPIETAVINWPTDDDLRLISSLNIKHLTILSDNLNTIELKPLRAISRLEALELEGNFVDAKALAPLTDCRKLRSLKIVGWLAAESLNPLHGCRLLDELHVSATSAYVSESEDLFGPITESHLAAIARIPNLQTLVIHSPGMPIKVIDRLASAQRLEGLYLKDVDLQNGLLNGLSEMPQLRLLSLSSDSSQRVEPIQGFPALTTLALHGARISPQFINSLQRVPRLETLSFSGSWVNESLFALAKNPRIKRLDLEGSDADVEGIRRIGRLYSLEVLQTSGFQDPEEYRDLFPRLQSRPAFAWNFGLDKGTWRYGAPMGGGGFY